MSVVFSSIHAKYDDVFAMIAILALFLTLAKFIFPSLTFYASCAKLAATLIIRPIIISSFLVAVVKGFQAHVVAGNPCVTFSEVVVAHSSPTTVSPHF